MSDISVTIHNFEDLLAGKTDFNGFLAGEGKMIEENIASLPAPLQPTVQLVYSSFKAGASSLVGAGVNGLGSLLAAPTDTQATMVLNMLQAAGVPTEGPLKAAELAAAITLINGLKAGLDRLGLKVATQGVDPAPDASKAD